MKIWPWILGTVGVGAGAWWLLKRNAMAEGWVSYPEGVVPGVTPGYPLPPSTDELPTYSEGGMQMGESYGPTSTGNSSYVPSSSNTTSSIITADAMGSGTGPATAATAGEPTTSVNPFAQSSSEDLKKYEQVLTAAADKKAQEDFVKAISDPAAAKKWDESMAAAQAAQKSSSLAVPTDVGAPTNDPAAEAASAKAQYDTNYHKFYIQALGAFKAGKLPMPCPGNTSGACAKAQVQALKDYNATKSRNQPAAQSASSATTLPAQTAQEAFNKAVKKAQDDAKKAREQEELRKRIAEQKAANVKAAANKAAADKAASDKAKKLAQQQAAALAAAAKKEAEKKALAEAQKRALAAAALMAQAAARAAAPKKSAPKAPVPKKAPTLPKITVHKPAVRGLTEAEYRAEAAKSAVEAQRREWAANELASRIAALTYME